MSERKLSTIRKIDKILPIENADFLVLAIVDGWQCVVMKDQFSEGEDIIFCEIDSVLPIREDLEFLRKGCYVQKDWLITEDNPTGEGFRLKTIRLRGQISQGLILKISNMNEFKEQNFSEGDCVDSILKIVKWDPPVSANLNGVAKGNFPSFIPKTDQNRIQNIRRSDLEPYFNTPFEVSLKMDGTSVTIYRFDEAKGICSRNLDLELNSGSTIVKTSLESGILEFLDEYQANLAFQGELCGPGIQGNHEGLLEHQLFIFDIYDINNGTYVDANERYEWLRILNEWQARKKFQATHHIPVYQPWNLSQTDTTETFLRIADGPSLLNTESREGLVFKSKINPNFSFKVISNQFLLDEK